MTSKSISSFPAPEQSVNQKVVYFPGINALRYIAAALVVFGHGEEFKAKFHFPNYYSYTPVYNSGGMAVTFFFVLSGFLITFLLLKEKHTYQTISVKSFYFRRALRIWPVYYLISTLGLFVLPHIASLALPEVTARVVGQYPTNILLYFFFLPNVALITGYFVPYASHLWSVGVEEQFYLFWPLLFKFSSKKLLPIIAAIIVIFFILRTGSGILSYHWLGEPYRQKTLLAYSLINATRLDCMAIGGIGAYLIDTNQRWFRQYCINRGIEITSLIIALILLIRPLHYMQHSVESIIFLLLIVNISCNEHSLLRLEGRVWTFLGNISYSVYMYQYLAIGSVLLAARALAILPVGPVASVGFHTCTQLLTIGLAYISYRYFEMPFLRYKKRFMKIKSTDNISS